MKSVCSIIALPKMNRATFWTLELDTVPHDATNMLQRYDLTYGTHMTHVDPFSCSPAPLKFSHLN